MRRVREILRLKRECGASDRAIGRSLGIARSTVALTQGRVAAAGLGVAAAGDAERPRCWRRCSIADAGTQQGVRRKAEPDWTACASRATPAGRHADAAVGGVSGERARRLRLQPLVRALPGLGRAAVADHAAGRTRPASGCSSTMPDRRSRSSTAGPARSATPRSSSPPWVPPATPTPRRPGPSRCRTGSARTRGPSLFSAACRPARARQPKGRGRPGQLVRAGAEPDLSRPGDALRHRDPAGPGAQAARQGQGRGGGAGGRALDPGSPAPPPLLLAGRAQRGDGTAGHRRPEQRRDMLEIVEERYGRGATLITSQIPVDRWHDLIGDPTLGDAILDRVIHNAHRLQLSGRVLAQEGRAGRSSLTFSPTPWRHQTSPAGDAPPGRHQPSSESARPHTKFPTEPRERPVWDGSRHLLPDAPHRSAGAPPHRPNPGSAPAARARCRGSTRGSSDRRKIGPCVPR